MAIIRRSLGNKPEIIETAFRQQYTDGLGGYAFRIFCDGWRAAWKEARQVFQSAMPEPPDETTADDMDG